MFTTTSGRYYFSPRGTPFVDAEHNFISRNWNDRNWPHGQGLGEDLATDQTWSNGQAPAVPPNNEVIGDPLCLILGEPISNALPYNQIRDGFNTACFRPTVPLDPLWETASSFSQCSLQFFYATVLQWIYNGEASKISTAFQLLLGPSVVTTFHGEAGIFPAMVTVISPEFSIAVVTGTTSYQQLALQGFFGLTGPQNVGRFSCNLVHYACSQYIHDTLVSDGALPAVPVFLVGHSYGGVSAHVLAGRYRFGLPARTIRTLTFGDPKPGDNRLHELLAAVPGIALHNTEDFVTILPPDLVNIFPVSVALGLVALLLMDRWEYSPNRTMMDEAGALFPNQSTAISTATLTNYVLRAQANLPLGVIFQHAIPVYRERILARCPNREWPISLPLWNLLMELDLGRYWGNDFFGIDFWGEDFFY